MYARNSASPERLAIGAVVQISDGAVQTSGVSVKVLPIGTTASAGGGTIAYEEGIVHYLPTQAETNYTSFIVIAYKTGCIPVSQTVVTVANTALATQASVDDLPTNAELATALAAADDAVLAAIGDLPTNAELATALAAADDAVLAAVADIPTNAELATALAAADDAVLAAIDALPTAAENADAVWDEAIAGHAGVGSTGAALAAAGGGGDPWSTALPGAYGAGTAGQIVGDFLDAAVSGVPTAAEIADAVHDEAVDGAVTLRQSIRLNNSALGGKASGLGTSTATFRDLADSKDRIVATVDADGNRTAVTRDLT
jgi:hypothetical protein